MTIRTQDDRAEWLAERTAWARQALDVPADAGPDDVRAAMLERLAELDFVPMPGQRLAIRVLADRDYFPPAADSHAPYVAAVEERLQDEVAAFAREFFRLPVPQRRLRWAELRDRCQGFAVPALRLRALEPGLHIDAAVDEAEPPPVKKLAAHLAAAFVLPPAERHALHREFLRQIGPPAADAADQTDWAEAVRSLRRNYRVVALLDLGFLELLMARQRARPDAKITLPTFLAAEPARTPVETATATRRIERETKRDWGGIGRYLLFVAIVGAALARGLSTSRDHSYTPTQVPEIKMPVIPSSPPPSIPPGILPDDDNRPGKPSYGRPPSSVSDDIRRMIEENRKRANPPGQPPGKQGTDFRQRFEQGFREGMKVPSPDTMPSPSSPRPPQPSRGRP